MPRSPRAKPRLITDALLRGWPLPSPAKGGSKEERGRALIIAGAVEMPGAAILAGTAALRAGAGKARVATAEAAALAVGAAVPELFVLGIAEGKRRASSLNAILHSAMEADAVLIGPGVRDEDAIRKLLPELLRIEHLRALIIDATALAIAGKFLTRRNSLAGKTILTPHAAEMASLCELSIEAVERHPQQVAREAAKRFGSIVVLKGAETFIGAEKGPIYLNKRGNVGLATAGAGDVLAGVLVGLCARGTDPLRAAVWAVSLHARAGESLAKRVGPIGYLAREIVDEIPRIIRAITSES
jgi:ADP-dependent NAD(P)H-hydrate dehydratase